jgi:ParB family transcriptional regulator, chromosome partitioning protein
MTMATAGNVAVQDKEKVEKRRALGRGLESLLPGPRVVPPTQSSGAGQQQVPHGRVAPVRNDNAAQVDAAAETSRAGVPASNVAGPHPADLHRAELLSAGQPRAVVPTQSSTADVERDAAGEPITIHAMAEPARTPGNLVVNLALTDIDKNPFQTRYVEDDEALEELAESIKANGVVQPIVVRPSEEDAERYVLVLGERRLHASKKAGKTHIPALVRKVSLQQAAEMTIVENLQREDLSPLEQAEAFRVLSMEFKMTQQQIAERVGLSRVSVANYMRLLKLPREVMQLLIEKKLNFAQAKELLKLDDNDRIAEAAAYAVKRGMNVEQIETLVMRMEGLLDPSADMPGQAKKSGGARWVNPDPNVRAAQVDLERMLGVRVRIRDRKGKGKIVIEYSTVDDYERVVEMLRGKK